MKRSMSWVLAAVVATGSLASLAQAENPAPKTDAKPAAAAKPEKPKSVMVPPPYNGLDLTEAQKTQISEKFAAQKAALAEWTTKHGGREAEIKQGLIDAKAAKDKEKMNSLSKESATLKAERAAIEEKYQGEIKAVLTPEQQKKMAVANIYSGLANTFSKANLTEAQKAEVRARAAKAADEVAGKDEMAKKTILNNVREGIKKEVLTDAQRAELAKPKE
jgi:Spy/CpxP family protein refolding chaperone